VIVAGLVRRTGCIFISIEDVDVVCGLVGDASSCHAYARRLSLRNAESVCAVAMLSDF
jgi:hypothetical protein